MQFLVMHRDEAAADVYISEDRQRVHIEKIIPDGIRQPFSGDRLDLFRVYNFLKSRCYEDGRADLQEILGQFGMTWNNPWEWVRKTHGVTYDDFFWIRFPGENLTWEDVRLR